MRQAEGACPPPASFRIVQIFYGHGFLLLSHEVNMGYSLVNTHIYAQIRWQIHDIDSEPPLLAVSTTHARAQTLVPLASNMHSSQWNLYLLVRLDDVWRIFCLSKPSSVPFGPKSPGKLEETATELKKQYPLCVVSSFWDRFLYKAVNNWSHDTISHWRWRNVPESYRTHHGRSTQFYILASPR